MYLMRKRRQKFPDIFSQNVAILDDFWTQMVGGHYAVAMENNKLKPFNVRMI